jgi:6-phosphogluconolactonase (cycloisomerase 2 family)
MSNYTKSTNFTAKDSLPTGDTNKVIRGSEFDTEFDAIQTAVGTKADLAGPTFTGTATFANLTATGTVNFTGGSVTTNIDGGTIDGVTIGGSSAGAGTFSSLVATTADINAGTVDNTVIGGATPAAGTFSSLTATTANIDGGNIDGTVIGASSTAAISGTTGTFSGAVTGSNLNVSNWDTAYGWGDHGAQGYLTSVTFSDIDAGAVTLSSETFVDSDTQIPTNAAVIDYVAATIPLITEVNDLTVSVTWANVPDANITQSSVTQHQAALAIAASQLSDVTATAAELNYTDGVTSNIQTQLDSKVGASYTGDVNITGELLVDSYNETFKKVSSVSAVSGYSLSSASYASKSFSVASQDTAPYGGIFMKPDGTKMWYLSANLSDVFQYSLSTAYDVSTASYDSVSFSVTAQDDTPHEIYFKPDGTKFYVVGDTNNTVFQYALSTAWDLSTASYESKSFSVATQETAPKGIEFKPDGTKMFIVGSSGDDVNRYSLSTAWDVSTASFDSQTLDVSSQDTAPQSIAFNSDGTVLFMLGQTNDKVFKYTLSTAYDLSSGSYSSVDFSIASQENIPYGLHFNDSGKKMYILGDQNDTVYQYSTSLTTYTTTFDCENANVFETVLEGNTTVVFSNPPAAGSATDSTAYAMSLKVVQDSGASGYTVTWPASVDWPSATAPTLTATANAVDQFVFYTYTGGTTWYGFTAGQALG